jgi:hypothetical protein
MTRRDQALDQVRAGAAVSFAAGPPAAPMPGSAAPVCKCGAGQSENDPQRCARGHGLPGNQLGAPNQFRQGNWIALRDASRTDRWPPELDALRADVAEFMTQTLADEGDASDVPARRRSLLEYRARLHRRVVQLDGILELRGPFDKHGKFRATWFAQLSALIERARQLDVTLGLERREKKVESLAEYIERAYGRREQADDARVRADDDHAAAGNQDGAAGTHGGDGHD